MQPLQEVKFNTILEFETTSKLYQKKFSSSHEFCFRKTDGLSMHSMNRFSFLKRQKMKPQPPARESLFRNITPGIRDK
jgi:hypothetical protein